MSLTPLPTPVIPTHLDKPDEDLTTQERLARAVTACKLKFGPDWNPLVRIAELAERAAAAGDLKTALSGYQTLADRYAPKLKAIEVRGPSQDVPTVIELVADSGTNRRFHVD